MKATVGFFSLLLCVGFLACCLCAEAHIGSPNVFFEGRAGEYPVHVVIRPPQVVPGLAEISVRVQGGAVQHVTVLPVFWKAGRKGAPPPDEAKPVRGETNLFSAALWLMKPGAYSVEIAIDGAQGKGILAVPVNSIATNTRPMSTLYSSLLLGLGSVLFVLALKIAGAMARESRLAPGAAPGRKDRWRGRVAVALAALVLSLMILGGKKWWDYEEREYRNNSLYQPQPVSAQVRTERDQPILKLTVDEADRRGEWAPLVPDHGKLMHLFLVAAGEKAFAHLHPLQKAAAEFEAPLPPIPAGSYHLYADVTHENGFSETLTSLVEIPPPSSAMKQLWLGNSAEAICSAAVAQRLATNLFFAPDADDSWQTRDSTAAPQSTPDLQTAPEQFTAEAGGGYKMIWLNPEAIPENREVSLRFKLLGPDHQPARIEPYMGMPGHAVVRRNDGAVFAHLHPLGTFSMAAQELFSNTSKDSPDQPRLTPALHSDHTNVGGVVQEIAFPYAFPKPGDYRIWVQAKSEGRILTTVFETVVARAR